MTHLFVQPDFFPIFPQQSHHDLVPVTMDGPKSLSQNAFSNKSAFFVTTDRSSVFVERVQLNAMQIVPLKQQVHKHPQRPCAVPFAPIRLFPDGKTDDHRTGYRVKIAKYTGTDRFPSPIFPDLHHEHQTAAVRALPADAFQQLRIRDRRKMKNPLHKGATGLYWSG